MSNGEFFGDLTRQAEIDLCAANYLRHRLELASASVQKMLEGLETRAQEFWNRGEEQIRALAPEGTAPDVMQAQSEMFLTFITNHLAKSEPGPERIALCNRMIVESGASDDLQTVLWLIGEALVLPSEPSAGSRTGGEGSSQVRASVQPQAAPREPARPPAADRRPQARAAGDADQTRADAVGASEFFDVAVPAHERDKARLIIADARDRASEEGHYNNSPYVAGRGLNAWQPKLLKAAFAQAMVERGKGPSAPPAAAPPAVEPAAPAIEEDETEAQAAVEVSAEPVDDVYGDDDVVDRDSRATASSDDLFPEPLDEDHDDAPEITVPLQPLPRPQPTVLHPAPASRTAPPPVRQPGAGLMASRVGAPAPARPGFLPPRERV
jgi:hypothetical protein